MKIIYLSGIDGCGKTTQAHMLVRWLENHGVSAEYQWLRWEPSLNGLIARFRRLTGRSKPAGLIAEGSGHGAGEQQRHDRWSAVKRRLMSSSLFRKIWLFYSTRDYFRCYKRANRTWSSEYVVMDRYIFDYIIDQSINFSMSPEAFMEEIESTALMNMCAPTYEIYIDLPAEIGYQRKMDGTPLEYLRSRQELYKGVPERDNILHVEGTKSVEMIHRGIVDWLSERMGIANER